METMTMSLERLWQEIELEATRSHGGGVLRRMVAPESRAAMYIGIHQPGLQRTFMLQALKSLLPTRDQIPESKGFIVAIRVTGDEKPAEATVILTAPDRSYNEVFTAMVENLCAAVAVCGDQKDQLALFLNGLAQWQEFFEPSSAEGLSREAQLGLYGELHFIKEHLSPVSGLTNRGLTAWTGPVKRQHDFQFGTVAVEVKVSTSKHHQKVYISNEQQLDEHQVDALFLVHLSLAEMENNPDTLPHLVAVLRDELSQAPARTLFENGLREAKYFDTQAWRYERTGYVIRETNVFRVQDSFPRLTERDLRNGVGDLRYSVSIDECRQFSVGVEEMINCIREACDE